MNHSPTNLKQERMAPFLNWWKTDDPEWVKQRKLDWAFLEKSYFSESTRDDKKQYKDYFLAGYIDTYIPPLSMFLMTPMVNIEQVKQFFYSQNFDVHDRSSLMSAFFILTTDSDVLVWYKPLAKLFAEAIMTKEYKLLQEVKDGSTQTFSPPPTIWCRGFAVTSIRILQGQFVYHGYMELVDHFISALSYADDPEERPYKRFNKFLTAIDEAQNNEALSADTKRFAQELKQKKQQIIAAYEKNAHLDT